MRPAHVRPTARRVPSAGVLLAALFLVQAVAPLTAAAPSEPTPLGAPHDRFVHVWVELWTGGPDVFPAVQNRCTGERVGEIGAFWIPGDAELPEPLDHPLLTSHNGLSPVTFDVDLERLRDVRCLRMRVGVLGDDVAWVAVPVPDVCAVKPMGVDWCYQDVVGRL